MEELYSELAEILSEEKVEADDLLAEFDEWDSLAILSVIIMLDENYGIKIDRRDLSNLKTGRDIENLVHKKAGLESGGGD
jgi:acyl carrier protein